MRDPDRIPRLLDLLNEIWKLNPDLRLGQIIEWEAHKAGLNVFYIEDDIMEQQLKARLAVEREVQERRGG